MGLTEINKLPFPETERVLKDLGVVVHILSDIVTHKVREPRDRVPCSEALKSTMIELNLSRAHCAKAS